MSTAVARVVVLGGEGPAAWLAAAALLRAFAHRKLEVTLIEGRPRVGAALGALPSLRGLHARIGLDEDELVRATGATFRLGERFIGWGARGDFPHVHSEIGVQMSRLDFYKYLMREHLAGRSVAPQDMSAAAIAADAGRFARPVSDPKSPLGVYTYGLHLDEIAYTRHLRTHGEKLGVRRRDGDLADVALRADGAIEALILADGARIEGDLYLDCSGSDALLMSRLSPDIEDWSPALACDRVLFASGERGALSPLTEIRAAKAGWMWRMALQYRTQYGYVFSSAHADEAGARAELAAVYGVRDQGFVNALKQGRRTAPWAKNCVAIGAAAAVLEPMSGVGLHLAQCGITNLVSLFPLDARRQVEAGEFNRLMGEYAAGLRDFVLAHYRLSAAQGAFWDIARAAPLPDRLAHKLSLFAATGKIGLLDHETFEETDWAWLLLGAGHYPDALEPHVAMLLEQAPAGAGAQIASVCRQAAQTLPPQEAYLSRLGLVAPGAPG